MPDRSPLIVADIGGTNARFGLAEFNALAGTIQVEQINTYRNADFPSLVAVTRSYLAGLPLPAPIELCIGIAGPSDGRNGFMANLEWEIDADRLERECALERVLFVNDFAALSTAVPFQADNKKVLLNPGSSAGGPISIVGPGTGLGVGQLVPQGDGYLTVSTEGGHMCFAPRSELEFELQCFLAPDGGYLAAEAVISGPGLENIHRFLCHRNGTDGAGSRAETISASALVQSDPVAVEAVELFLACLGSFAGDVALAHGATGGLYLGGGILPRLSGLLAASSLLERFCDKGPLSDYARDIPAYLITADFVALEGAAELFWRHQRR